MDTSSQSKADEDRTRRELLKMGADIQISMMEEREMVDYVIRARNGNADGCVLTEATQSTASSEVLQWVISILLRQRLMLDGKRVVLE